MADYLINFNSGEKILASETNSNNQYLLDKISDNAETLQNYLATQINSIQSNLSSVQKTLQNNIDTLNKNLTEQIDTINSRTFTQKSLALSTGTTSLNSYLPKDGKQYLVWINAYVDQKSGNNATVATDVMSARTILQLDGDAGRSSKSICLTVVPVGAGRKITISGSINWVNLCGYMRI